ncbi:MAG: homoserine dehydrogenase [Vulcanimicrobiota bacterium]
MRPRLVTKFGGTSLADKRAWLQTLSVLESRKDKNPLIVVSAVGSIPGRPKVTDLLLDMMDSEDPEQARIALESLHRELLHDLELPGDLLDTLFEELRQEVAGLGELRGHEQRDRVVRFGESFSAVMMSALLNGHGWKTSVGWPPELGMVSTESFGDADLLEETLEKMASAVIASTHLLVVPGFIAVTEDGRPTTLGRGGSDYTAAAFGAALKRDVEIWSDVDGVAAANPTFFNKQQRAEGHPRTIQRLSHEEAYQMAAFGSRVLYQKCLSAARLAARKGRHLRMILGNTFNPEGPRTIVESHRDDSARAKGITALEKVQLLTVYLARDEDYRKLYEEVTAVSDGDLLMASYSTGRASFVFDTLTPQVEALERKFREAHLSRDQVLIKVVGDGMASDHHQLAKIHQAIASLDNPDKYGAPLVHKSPQLLTSSSFEVIALKRGSKELIRRLYRDLFRSDEVQVAMVGLGTVGGGVLEYSTNLFSTEKTAVKLGFPLALVRDKKKPRSYFQGKLVESFEEILKDERVDVVAELMGGLEPAREYVLKALQAGKDVVTANKALMAEHGKEILDMARKHRRNIGFEAAVCGEIPIIETVRNLPSDADVQGFVGIFNGTSNYIISKMMEGRDYGEALAAAQEAGFAEADPTLDVNGSDATQKLAILSSIIFHTPVEWRSIWRRGMEDLEGDDVKEFVRDRLAVRPLASARRTMQGLELWAGPALVRENHTMARVEGETAGVALNLFGRDEPFAMTGKGAGSIPTARSVVRDLYELARKARHRVVEVPSYHEGLPLETVPRQTYTYPWWVRFKVLDEPGVFGRIASVLGQHNLSITEAFQRGTLGRSATERESLAAIHLQLKRSQWGAVETALQAFEKDPAVVSTLALPIL